MKKRLNPLPPEITATTAFVKRRNVAERATLRDHLLLSYLANAPDHWDFALQEGQTFSATPENIGAIQKILGIKNTDRTIVAPVFSGDWSKLHPKSIGVDFSREALRNHPNPFRVKADLRDLPFPDQWADHIVMYEPTPMNPKVATYVDTLITATEAARVAKKVHVIQRVRNGLRIWTYPFLEHYFAGLGVPYRVSDLTEHVTVHSVTKNGKPLQVHAVTFKGKDLLKHKDAIVRDLRTTLQFLRNLTKKKSVDPADFAALLRKGTPALRKAIAEDVVLRRKPRIMRKATPRQFEGKHP